MANGSAASSSIPRSSILRVTVWILFTAWLSVAGAWSGMRTFLPGPSSKEAIAANPGERIASSVNLPLRDSMTVILEHPSLSIDDAEFSAAREDLLGALRAFQSATGSGPLFQTVQTPGHTWLPIEPFVSSNKRGVLFLAETSVPRSDAARALQRFPDEMKKWQARFSDFHLYYLSNGTADNEMFDLINSDLDHSLWVTVPLTMIVLVWSFGSIVSALIPLTIALMSLVASLGLTAVLSWVTGPISATAAQLIVLLVLAIGIDYSLFFVSRVREEIGRGATFEQAAKIAERSVGPAVFWSGLTVALSLVGLFLMHDTVLTSMALVALGAVIVTVAGTLLSVPAILELLGPSLFRWSFGGTRTEQSRWNDRFLQSALSHPMAVLISTFALLGALSSTGHFMRLGSTVEPSTLPQSMQSARAFRALERSFTDLAGVDFTVVMQAKDLEELEEEGYLQPFFDELLAYPTVRGPFETEHSDDGTVMRVHFRAKGSTNDQENIELLQALRDRIGPQYLTKLGVSFGVSGTLPFALDETTRYSQHSTRVFAGVLALSFIFLLVAFRSIVIPLKAVLLNLLSTTSAFGVLVVVFQSSWSPWGEGIIESFVPPLLFAILFGLSMDYHVFLLSRIREERESGLTSGDAIARGIGATARTVTSAALIMVVVFTTIASLQLPVMKQLGTGLAVAVLLDATVIRTLLLPASMLMLGKWNWYLPRWLEWIPRMKIH